MIVLDTNIVAVLMGTSRSHQVAGWYGHQAPTSIFITAVTRAEVRYGIARLPHGRRRAEYQRAADIVFANLMERTLDFDSEAADIYGEIVAHREALGRPIGVADAQIAAIALVHGATIATRDIDGFDIPGLEVVDPFADGGRA